VQLRFIYPFILLAGCLFAQDQVQINSPYVSTPHTVVDKMLDLAKPKADDVVYDLGCGDGRIVIQAAKQYGVRGVGIDNNPERIREAEENARREGVSHLVQFRIGDLYDADIEDATIVALYLLPDVNMKLRPKLKNELKPGARIVSHTFGMGDWKPNKQQTVDGEKIFLWKIRRKFPFFV
jgi:cyclopropane fatty-acyl-phospholipid synthase-like methyltransferase